MNNNFRFMLTALLVLLLVVPVAIDMQLFSPEIIRAIGFSALLAIGIWSLRAAGRAFSVAMALVIAGILLNILYAIRAESVFYVASNLAMLAFLMLATVESFRQIAASRKISANRIVGAICVYLLLGVIWSLLFALLEYMIPGSFKGLTEQALSGWSPDWVYYSFVTLTTLGYGDISPLTFSARALSYSEAIVGQFYLAILVAGLVGAYITAKSDDTSRD